VGSLAAELVAGTNQLSYKPIRNVRLAQALDHLYPLVANLNALSVRCCVAASVDVDPGGAFVWAEGQRLFGVFSAKGQSMAKLLNSLTELPRV